MADDLDAKIEECMAARQPRTRAIFAAKNIGWVLSVFFNGGYPQNSYVHREDDKARGFGVYYSQTNPGRHSLQYFPNIPKQVLDGVLFFFSS